MIYLDTAAVLCMDVLYSKRKPKLTAALHGFNGAGRARTANTVEDGAQAVIRQRTADGAGYG